MTAEQIDEYLEYLLKSKMQPFLGEQSDYKTLAKKLRQGLENNLRTQDDGLELLPDTFTIIAPPQKLAQWQSQHNFVNSFKSVLLEAAQKLGRVFAAPPNISLTANPSLGVNEIDLIASYHLVPGTGALSPSVPKETPAASLPSNAFLILDGNKVFKLRQEVINIGRRLDNHIVLNDPRVSRNHAQLRVIKGRYVIFDLNSTGGTYINGQRINQSILYPGDVISLAGATLVYGQDDPPPSVDMLGTQPLSTPSSATDLPTAVIDSDIQKKVAKKNDNSSS